MTFLYCLFHAFLSLPVPAGAVSQDTLFRDVRLFDGASVAQRTNVLVHDGKIAGVGKTITAPKGVIVVDGEGKTLLPGLIDCHTHAFDRSSLVKALAFGVTTELDMFTSQQWAASMRKEQRIGQATDRADLFSAGTLATAPGGHGTEFGLKIPTISGPGEAEKFVDDRIKEGSDYLKIVIDDGSTYKRSMATLSAQTLRALVNAAHGRQKLTVVHIGDLAGAREAIESGADGLAHLFVDKAPSPDFGRLAAMHKTFVVPTLCVLQAICGTGSGTTLTTDSKIAPFLTNSEKQSLKIGFPGGLQWGTRLEYAEQTIRLLKSAHVAILAGTDAGNPGTMHGASLHRELEMLVHAGLTPKEALMSATSVAADRFRIADRGRIALGERADLLLVEGDPTTNILATRNIVGIWKDGKQFDRNTYRTSIAKVDVTEDSAPEGSQNGLVSDFEDGKPSSRFGLGWSSVSDEATGGKSVAELKVVDGGADGSSKSLSVSGMVEAGERPYAGIIFLPGASQGSAVNLSSKKEIRFWIKGDGQTYIFRVFGQAGGYQTAFKNIVAGPDWKEIVYSWNDLKPVEGKGFMGVMVSAGLATGKFRFQIDQFQIR